MVRVLQLISVMVEVMDDRIRPQLPIIAAALPRVWEAAAQHASASLQASQAAAGLLAAAGNTKQDKQQAGNSDTGAHAPHAHHARFDARNALALAAAIRQRVAAAALGRRARNRNALFSAKSCRVVKRCAWWWSLVAVAGAVVRLHSALLAVLTHLVGKLKGGALADPQVSLPLPARPPWHPPTLTSRNALASLLHHGRTLWRTPQHRAQRRDGKRRGRCGGESACVPCCPGAQVAGVVFPLLRYATSLGSQESECLVDEAFRLWSCTLSALPEVSPLAAAPPRSPLPAHPTSAVAPVWPAARCKQRVREQTAWAEGRRRPACALCAAPCVAEHVCVCGACAAGAGAGASAAAGPAAQPGGAAAARARRAAGLPAGRGLPAARRRAQVRHCARTPVLRFALLFGHIGGPRAQLPHASQVAVSCVLGESVERPHAPRPGHATTAFPCALSPSSVRPAQHHPHAGPGAAGHDQLHPRRRKGEAPPATHGSLASLGRMTSAQPR